MEKYVDVRNFANFRLNMDTEVELLQPNEVRDALNMVEEYSSGKVVNMKGFQNVFSLSINSNFSLPAGAVFKCIGTVRDIGNSAIVYFLCDTAGTKHSILRMFTTNYALEWILVNQPILNFQPTYRIKANILEDLLYWTDGYEGTAFVDYNPPRKINMVKAAAMTNTWTNGVAYPPGSIVSYNGKAYRNTPATTGNAPLPATVAPPNYPWVLINTGAYTALTQQILDRIKWPPAETPQAAYDSDPTRVNLLRNKLFQFSTRYVYDDHEKSTWGPYSEIPLPTQPEYQTGVYFNDDYIDNTINVTVDSGPAEVTRVDLMVREGNIGNWRLVKRFDKYDEDGNVLIPSDTSVVYAFHNDEAYEGLDQIDCARPYDAVPQISRQQEIIEKNRLLDADYTEGFDNLKINAAFTVNQQAAITNQIIDEWNGYSNGIVNVPPGGIQILMKAYDHQHPNDDIDTFGAYDVNFNPIYTDNALYVVSFEVYIPARYGSDSYSDYPHEYVFKTARAVAVVDAVPGMTIGTFLDRVVTQFRYGSSLNCLIPILNYYTTSKGYNLWGNYESIYYSGYGIPGQGGGYTPQGWMALIMPQSVGYGDAMKPFKLRFNIVKMTRGSLKQTSFKSGCSHRFGIAYYDRAQRCGAVNTNDNCTVYIPDDPQVAPTQHPMFRNEIKWELSHRPPIWAKYWQLVYARNASIDYFIQAAINEISEAPESDYLYIDINTFIQDTQELVPKFKITPYEWKEGDRMRFKLINLGDQFKSFPAEVDLEIVGARKWFEWDEAYLRDNSSTMDYVLDGNGNKVPKNRGLRLMVKNFDYKYYGVAARNTVVEIYRKAKDYETIIYSEIGERMSVLNPYTANRMHQGGSESNSWDRNQTALVSARGTLSKGDVYIFTRYMGQVFPCESMWYSDFFESRDISIGRQNIVNPDMRRTRYFSKLLYSGKYIQDTHVNNLSRVDSSDSITLADKYGPIYHIEEVGYTLKILQKFKPSSLYVGRAGVTQPSEETREILTSTKDVLGTLIVHKSDRGTQHPHSVCKFDDRYWFFDFDARAICRDAGNGIDDISETYNIKREMQTRIDAMGTADNVDVVTGYDQVNSLVLFTFIDRTTAANSFTLAFKDKGGKNNDGFVGFFSFIQEDYGVLKQVLTSWKSNALWLHNDDNAPRCNFNGVQYPYYVTVVSNKDPLIFKRYLTIFVNSDKKFSCPNAGDITISPTGNNPAGMVSLLKAGAFASVEGNFVAEFGRNMTTHQLTPSIGDLVNGDDLAGQALIAKLQGSETTEHKLFLVQFQGVTSKV